MGKYQKAYTAPKGRATAARETDPTTSRLSATMEWILWAVAVLLVLGAVMWLGRNVSTDHPGGHNGEQPVPASQTVDAARA